MDRVICPLFLEVGIISVEPKSASVRVGWLSVLYHNILRELSVVAKVRCGRRVPAV